MGDIIEVPRKDGGKSYKARVRRKGARLYTKTFSRKSDALKWITSTEAGILEGRNPLRVTRYTLGEAIDYYEANVLSQKKTSTQYVQRSMLRWWAGYLGAKRLAEVELEDLQRAQSYLLTTPVHRVGSTKEKRRGPAAVNRYFGVLRHVYSKAMRFKWIHHNPVALLDPLKEPKGRVRILSDEELHRIVKALDEHERPDFRFIVLIALTTGCRRGNAQSLRWEHVDFEKLTITFPDTKNNRAHSIPIDPDLAADLRRFKRSSGAIAGPIFPSKPGSMSPNVDIKQQWRRFAAGLGMEDLHFHDLRHAAASHLAKNNVPLLHIGKLLGHQSLESTKRYAHLLVNDLEPHVATLGARLRRVK